VGLVGLPAAGGGHAEATPSVVAGSAVFVAGAAVWFARRERR
jgi:hypothetical protein